MEAVHVSAAEAERPFRQVYLGNIVENIVGDTFNRDSRRRQGKPISWEPSLKSSVNTHASIQGTHSTGNDSGIGCSSSPFTLLFNPSRRYRFHMGVGQDRMCVEAVNFYQQAVVELREVFYDLPLIQTNFKADRHISGNEM